MGERASQGVDGSGVGERAHSPVGIELRGQVSVNDRAESDMGKSQFRCGQASPPFSLLF